MEEPLAARLGARLEALGLAMDAARVESLAQYLELLTRWNRRMNLTALPLEPLADRAIDRLIVEPLVVARLLRPADRTLIDIGSGGGSPAIPLKIAMPHLQLVMVEARQKKAAFLREAVRVLRLSETSVEARRVEEVAEDERRVGIAEAVTLRAVQGTSRLWQAVAALLRSGGRVYWLDYVEQPNAEFPATAGLVRVVATDLPPGETIARVVAETISVWSKPARFSVVSNEF